MENMQFHEDSQIQSNTLSFVKSCQLLKIEDHSSLNYILGKSDFEASCLNGADRAFAGL